MNFIISFIIPALLRSLLSLNRGSFDENIRLYFNLMVILFQASRMKLIREEIESHLYSIKLSHFEKIHRSGSAGDFASSTHASLIIS